MEKKGDHVEHRMFIGQLARQTGVPIKTIRYYESFRLFPEAPRTASGYRLYGQEAAEILAFIRKAQNLGLALSQIRDILDLSRRGRCPCGHVERLLKERLKELEEKMRDWRHLRQRILQAIRKPVEPSQRVGGIALCPRIADLRAPRGKQVKKGGLRP